MQNSKLEIQSSTPLITEAFQKPVFRQWRLYQVRTLARLMGPVGQAMNINPQAIMVSPWLSKLVFAAQPLE
jgi:hypothetical protein